MNTVYILFYKGEPWCGNARRARQIRAYEKDGIAWGVAKSQSANNAKDSLAEFGYAWYEDENQELYEQIYKAELKFFEVIPYTRRSE